MKTAIDKWISTVEENMSRDELKLRLLLRELVMRGNYALPENKQDERWYQDGIGSKKSPKFLIKVFEILKLGSHDRL